jgi:hypothetical protein
MHEMLPLLLTLPVNCNRSPQLICLFFHCNDFVSHVL